MIVIKLGGSLLASEGLLQCLKTIEKIFQGRDVIVVPGGGCFADQVRTLQKRWHFDDKAAHEMAVLAMQQMAILFQALNNTFEIFHLVANFPAKLKEKNLLIWSPDIRELDSAGIAASWDITSDSLAAWLAKTLAADELILVKSIKLDQHLSCHDLGAKGIVDKAFARFVSGASFELKILDKDSFYDYS
jgi:5-(aminomethyl)-3-furanmethanol phosphate kinase